MVAKNVLKERTEPCFNGNPAWFHIRALPALLVGEGGWHLPKKELVSVMQILLQSRRLQVARQLPMATVLVKELETFRVKVTTSANETFESWRERDHDDLVLAVAMAAWVGERALWKLCIFA